MEEIYVHIYCSLSLYLQNVPSHEKHVILGCQWFKVEWNPSKQLVSALGESLLISFSMLVFMRISCILSDAFVPKEKTETIEKLQLYKVRYNRFLNQ